MKKLIFSLVSIALAASIMFSASYSVLFAYVLRDGIAALTSPVLKLTAPADKYLEENPYRVTTEEKYTAKNSKDQSKLKKMNTKTVYCKNGTDFKNYVKLSSVAIDIVFVDGTMYYRREENSFWKNLKCTPTKEELEEWHSNSDGGYTFDIDSFGSIEIMEASGSTIIRCTELDDETLSQLESDLVGDNPGYEAEITNFLLDIIVEDGKYKSQTMSFDCNLSYGRYVYIDRESLDFGYVSLTEYDYENTVIENPDPEDEIYRTVTFGELMSEFN